MRKLLVLLIVLGLLSGCRTGALPTPGATPTQAALATTAAPTQTVQPSAIPSATSTATVPASPTPTPTHTATATPLPTIPPTATTRPPTATTRPPTAVPPTVTPAIGPALGSFAVVGVYANDVLNIRRGPGANQPIVGTVPFYGRGVEVFAGGQPVGGSWWLPARYQQVTGWVNGKFLAQQLGNVPDSIASQAARAILALRDGDLQALAGLVHPGKGVAFSPYTYVRPLQGQPGEADMVFSREQLARLWSDPTVYHWGYYAGSGQPIDLDFRAYYADFVYDVDFAQPEMVGFDETIGVGNTINNIADVYPNAVTVEYHFSGFDPQYGGMDWRSLRLVLEESQGTWYLLGIVHDEWTP